jgi:hypothetical protein
MTVAELIAHLQQLPREAVVVQSKQSDVSTAFILFGLCFEPKPVQMRAMQKWHVYPLPLDRYEIDRDGNVQGVLLE